VIVRPYRIFFRIDGGSVVGIVGILDGRRDIEELLAVRGIRG
jgi:plasmid stabilization system protein ParE